MQEISAVLPRSSIRVIKSINSNAAICRDGKGRKLIALGNGIGFGTVPREVPLSDIKRIFYGVDPKYLGLVSELPEDVPEFAAQLAYLARSGLSYELSPNLPVTLAFDVQQSYPAEYRIGEMAVHDIERTFSVHLPCTEAIGIALSIVNSAVSASAHDTERQQMTERLIEDSTKIVEQRLHISVGRDSFDYARFATHMRYLIGRLAAGEHVSSGAAALLPELQERYLEVSACGNAVADYLGQNLMKTLDEEERVYLILHVNRVFERETAKRP